MAWIMAYWSERFNVHMFFEVHALIRSSCSGKYFNPVNKTWGNNYYLNLHNNLHVRLWPVDKIGSLFGWNDVICKILHYQQNQVMQINFPVCHFFSVWQSAVHHVFNYHVKQLSQHTRNILTQKLVRSNYLKYTISGLVWIAPFRSYRRQQCHLRGGTSLFHSDVDKYLSAPGLPALIIHILAVDPMP